MANDDGFGTILAIGAAVVAGGVAAERGTKITRLEGCVTTLDTALAAERRAHGATAKQLTAAQHEIGALTDENEQLERRRDELFVENSTLINDLVASRQLNADQASQIAAKDSEIARLTTSSQAAAADNSRKDSRIAQLEAELRRLGHEVPAPSTSPASA